MHACENANTDLTIGNAKEYTYGVGHAHIQRCTLHSAKVTNKKIN